MSSPPARDRGIDNARWARVQRPGAHERWRADVAGWWRRGASPRGDGRV